MTYFTDLQLSHPILRALSEKKYTHPTDIQERAIPHILAGKDLMGIAQTGTGKTAAFALPLLQLLNEEPSSQQSTLPRALILTPTRELALQILANLKHYGKYLSLKFGAIFGGVHEKPQIRELKGGLDILVATPGRLLDLYHRKLFTLKGVRYCVLDEADRMLDMGFLPDVRKIMKELNTHHQTLLFSATLPSEIEELAHQFLNQPIRIEITPPATAAVTVEQHVIFIPKAQKQTLLQHILSNGQCQKLLVFSKTKYDADKIGRFLRQQGFPACVLHGDKSQKDRQRSLKHFQEGDVHILVATDVASRGIDISDISHVINFDLPDEPESYIHRIGRTGRAGKAGITFSFCDVLEKRLLRAIENKMQNRIPVLSAKQFWEDFVPEAPAKQEKSKQEKRRFYKSKHKSKHRSQKPKNTYKRPKVQ